MKKKFLKKIVNINFILFLIVPMMVAPYIVNAESKDNMTIKELTDELAKEEAQLKENENKSKLTADQITKIKNNINLIGKQMDESNANVIRLKKEIEELKVKIDSKDKEIKKVVNFLQVSSGESEYLEYAFGAKTFTDFIYRMAITEQLTDYNDKLIKEYNLMIENNKKKQEDEAVELENLKKKQIEANAESMKLQTEQSNLSSDRGSIKKGLEATRSILNELKSMGCDENDTITSCYSSVIGVPVSSSGMIRPVSIGQVTSEFGPRWGEIHGGIDIGVPVGTPVYAVASGTVVSVHDFGGTGLSVHILHNINGKYYTSCYQHLSQSKVYEKQVVYRGQVIASSGNTGFSLGAHLHFALFYGWAGIDYGIWSYTYQNMWFNPRFLVNF